MHKSILKYWFQIYNAFKLEAGNHILVATITSRLATFIGAWLALQLLVPEVLGEAIYAYQFVIFMLPFIGWGLHQGLLRFGAQITDEDQKFAMFRTVFQRGLIATIILSLGIFFAANRLTFQMPEAKDHLQLFSLVLITSFLYEILRTQFRILHLNKYYAYAEITYSLIFLFMISLMSYFWGIEGYVMSFVFSPLLSFIIWVHKVKWRLFFKSTNYSLTRKFWSYGIFASLGNVLTQLLFVIDILLIGNLLHSSNDVTIYKYLTLIPFSILFLSQVYMTTHFVTLTKKILQSAYLTQFIKRYHMLFLLIVILFLTISWLFKDCILAFFDPDFVSYSSVFMTLCIGSSGILLFRGLYGNLLSALGYANVNFLIAAIGLVVNIILNYYWIPQFGIQGAAFTSAVIMWLTGLLSASFFFLLLNKVTTKT